LLNLLQPTRTCGDVADVAAHEHRAPLGEG
jgi:hypothetical protein